MHAFGPTETFGPTVFSSCLTVIIDIMKPIVIIIVFFIIIISIVVVVRELSNVYLRFF